MSFSRRKVRWLVFVAAALLIGTASARTLATKNAFRGLPAVQQTLFEGELTAAMKGKLAEVRELVRQATASTKEKRAKLARELRSDSQYAKYRESLAKIFAKPDLKPETRMGELDELKSSHQKYTPAGQPLAQVPRKLRPATLQTIQISSALAKHLLQADKQVFKGPFPLQLEWSDLDPANASASLAKNASSDGSFSSSILIQGVGDAATEAAPGVEFTVPDSVKKFVVSTTIEIESSSAHANPDDDFTYCLTEAELRVWSYDYAVNAPQENEILISLLADHPGQLAEQTIGAKTVTLYSAEIAAQKGAKVHAFAGGVINVFANGPAWVTLEGKVKNITVHYVD